MSVRDYFKDIYDNIRSISIGMKITLKYCFQKTVTVQYPEQHLTFAPRYRGIHEFEAYKCMSCAQCTEACPTDCIHMGKLQDLSSYTREDVVVEFADIDKQNLRTPIPLW